MAILSTYFTGAGGKGFKVIVGATIADLPVAASVFPIGSKFINDATGDCYTLTSTAGVQSWVLTAGRAGNALAMGGNTLALGTKNIVPGPAVTANTRVFVSRTGAVPKGFAIGDELNITKTVGAAGVGSFDVTAISIAAGALVNTDVSTFDWIMYEPG